MAGATRVVNLVFLCVTMILMMLAMLVQPSTAAAEWPRTLYDAAERGDAAEVQTLLERNAESWLWLKMFSSAVNTQFAKAANGWAALHTASFHGHHNVVAVLLAWKTIDVNLRDSNGWTPLLVASRAGHVAVVKALLQDGRVDVNVPNNLGATPLWEAAHHRHLHVLEWIVAAGREVDVEQEGRAVSAGPTTTPLALAVDVAQRSWSWRSWLGQDDPIRQRAADVVLLLERFAGDSAGTRQEVRALLSADEVAALDTATRQWEATAANRGSTELARLKTLRATREARDGPAVQRKRRDREVQAKLAEAASAQPAVLKYLQRVSWPSLGQFVGTIGVTVAAAMLRAVCRAVLTGLYQLVRRHGQRRPAPRRPNPPVQRPRGGARINTPPGLLQVETQDGPCAICTEEDAVLVSVNTTCRHRFCLGCVDAHLQARQGERASYSCLAASCPEVIAANVVEVVGSKQTVDRHHRFAAETGSSSAPSAAAPIDAASLAEIARIAKTCPGKNCGAAIQKNEGCDHMTCRVCKHEFCWLCLGDWRTRTHSPTCTRT